MTRGRRRAGGREQRRVALRRAVLAAAAGALLLFPPAARATAGPAAEAEGAGGARRAGRIGFDLVILRPLSLVQAVVSVPFLAVFYPVARVTGGSDHVVEYFWTDPVQRPFRRPLGEL